MRRGTKPLFPTESTYSIYCNHRCIAVMVGEETAVNRARRLWEKKNQNAEISVVESGPTGINLIQSWYPAHSYRTGESLLDAQNGRLVSWRQKGAYGERRHFLSAGGEQRMLREAYGELVAIRDRGEGKQGLWWVEERKDASGRVTQIGIGCDIRTFVGLAF